MAEIKGKFITLTASLMEVYQEARMEADKRLFTATGTHWNELEPDGWYDIKHYNDFISTYVQASPSREKAMITLGRNIYPTIKETAGFPPGLTTPIDFIEFESRGYQENLRGPEIKPRMFLKKDDGQVIVQTKMTEQNCKVLEGVYLGILKMAGLPNATVEQKKCLRNGDSNCEFHITW